ncbi:hypothetical protein [Streptosporangium sp. NPDC002721]|uniref:hypothetical protein n=1 Tax=Streptosporangium sp. NPDC002721 TaxID=3366188 RepID=UPI003690E66C
MSTVIWVAVVVVAVVAIVAVGYLVLQQQRRHRLRDRFGPEYERTVQERENRRDAEQELIAREQRFSSLDIRALDAGTREIYAKKWMEVQERFVDAPGFAVTEADHLVTSVMAERGYPTENFEQRLSDLSVAHGRTLDHYRQAHEISTRAAHKEASTEELRQAMVHYRALFEELLEAPGSPADDNRASRRTESVDGDPGRTGATVPTDRNAPQADSTAPETTDDAERASRRDTQGR